MHFIASPFDFWRSKVNFCINKWSILTEHLNSIFGIYRIQVPWSKCNSENCKFQFGLFSPYQLHVYKHMPTCIQTTACLHSVGRRVNAGSLEPFKLNSGELQVVNLKVLSHPYKQNLWGRLNWFLNIIQSYVTNYTLYLILCVCVSNHIKLQHSINKLVSKSRILDKHIWLKFHPLRHELSTI